MSESTRVRVQPTLFKGCTEQAVPLSSLPEPKKESIIKGKISELNFTMLKEIDVLETKNEEMLLQIEALEKRIEVLERGLRQQTRNSEYYHGLLRLTLPVYKPSEWHSKEDIEKVLFAKQTLVKDKKFDSLEGEDEIPTKKGKK
jgi:hypothetical protein